MDQANQSEWKPEIAKSFSADEEKAVEGLLRDYRAKNHELLKRLVNEQGSVDHLKSEIKVLGDQTDKELTAVLGEERFRTYIKQLTGILIEDLKKL
jgi:hypothetical protein